MERRAEAVKESSENHDVNGKCQHDIRRRHYNPRACACWNWFGVTFHLAVAKESSVGSVSNFDGKEITSLSNQN
jgi:hypothetical protein